MSIDKFTGQYRFLSNFCTIPGGIHYLGYSVPTAEHAYQLAKAIWPSQRKLISRAPTPHIAKILGRYIRLNAEQKKSWEKRKKSVMRSVLEYKFEYWGGGGSEGNLAKLLIATKNEELIEGNNWHDNYWGNCYCAKCKDIQGKNILGQLLMDQRAQLRNYYTFYNVSTLTTSTGSSSTSINLNYK